jgi:hypothetical protein
MGRQIESPPDRSLRDRCDGERVSAREEDPGLPRVGVRWPSTLMHKAQPTLLHGPTLMVSTDGNFFCTLMQWCMSIRIGPMGSALALRAWSLAAAAASSCSVTSPAASTTNIYVAVVSGAVIPSGLHHISEVLPLVTFNWRGTTLSAC